MAGVIRAGIGGWTFEPWRGLFYPNDLPQKRELEYASRAVTTIEINGTYYSTFKPDSWQRWADETPDDFVFSVKASRFCTNRKVLADAGPSIEKFMGQGLSRLGRKLGPVNWQFAGTKRFDPEDFESFLRLLPRSVDGLPVRHALEVRNPSFAVPGFYALARKYGAAIVHAQGEDYPLIDEATAPFTYLRIMTSEPALPDGFKPAAIRKLVQLAGARAPAGDVFVYFISGAKERNPAAAIAFLKALRAATPAGKITRPRAPRR